MAGRAVSNGSINIYSINNNNSITGGCVCVHDTHLRAIWIVFFSFRSRFACSACVCLSNPFTNQCYYLYPFEMHKYPFTTHFEIYLSKCFAIAVGGAQFECASVTTKSNRLFIISLVHWFVRSVHFTMIGGGGVQQPRWSYCTNTNRANDWRQICYPRTLWYTSR